MSALFHLLCASGDLACNVADEAARVSMRELAEMVLRQAPLPHRFAADRGQRPDDGDGGSGESVFLDCSRLRALGWTPRVDLSEGIARTLRHHRTEAAHGSHQGSALGAAIVRSPQRT